MSDLHMTQCDTMFVKNTSGCNLHELVWGASLQMQLCCPFDEILPACPLK